MVEQVTYLLFARRLDEIHTTKEAKANLLGQPIEDPIFSKMQQHLRCPKFRDLAPQATYAVFRDEVFRFIKSLNREQDSAYAKFMKDAVFVIPLPSLLDRVVEMLDAIPMEDRDTKWDLYEYLLSNLQHQGRNGQFRTSRHSR